MKGIEMWKWMRRRWRILTVAASLVSLLVVAGVTIVWSKLYRELPQDLGSSDVEEYFKYGSIGTEAAAGVPYHIWRVLPRVFPEHLPRDPDGNPRGLGYDAVGAVWEPGSELPIGFSVKTIGFPRVGINCAACHTATYRTEPDGELHRVLTGPSQRFDSLAYTRFLIACGMDERFTADTLLPEMQEDEALSLLDRLLYRYVIIPQTARALRRLEESFAYTEDEYRREAVWGAGRIDPLNVVKYGMLGLPMDRTIGNTDMMPIWNMEKRDGQALHWDGLSTSLIEVTLSSAIGDGATNQSLPARELERIAEYTRIKQPPKYPFLDSLRWSIVGRGREIFEAYCAVCHEQGGARTGTVIPLDEIATDRHRLDNWSAEAAAIYNQYSEDYPWDFDHFRKTDGYVAGPLDGVWLTAPYLHNGSVPTMEDLLKPAHERPRRFYRGYDVYDRERMGFVHQGSEARRWGFEVDVSKPGNSNQGHEGEAYGTELPADDKRALIEYLKTL